MDMSVWFLVATAMVFFMQAGFAMVETGFTRAKNAGNIIMKNLMDFCVGTVVFVFLGYGLLCSPTSVGGFLGVPDFTIFSDFANFDWSGFAFNLVFCATAATIVSGAMAERTKFSSYLIYSAVISAFIYPIEAHWVWNANGWLFKLGFIDFAGSAAIHMVGGISALIGAIFLGPRIGKYVKDKDGKLTPKAIPGHSITLGALGVFILWFGWYGFNGAAAGDVTQMAAIYGTTTIAAGVATCVTMAFTWIKNGKPDVSMTLNGSLAGLVGITAGCANVDAFGALMIGIIAGIWVVVVVEFLDFKAHVDDPVGAVAVHGGCGMLGTFCVGLFAVDGGLFYGGGFRLLGIQCLGILCIAAWTAVTISIMFVILKKTNGIRVSKEEEIMGLDPTEHGLAAAYADFMPAVDVISADAYEGETVVSGDVEKDKAVPVTIVKTEKVAKNGNKITKVEIICRERALEALKNAMMDIGITGMTVSHVLGCGLQKGAPEMYRGVVMETSLLPKIQVDIVVCKVPVEEVVKTAQKVLYTGHIGDGKIFVYDVENAIKVRTGEQGYDALQDVE